MRFFVFNIVPTFIEIFMVVGILLYNYGWGFALITLSAVLAYVWFSVAATEWRTKFVREANIADSASNNRAVDSLLNFETVKYLPTKNLRCSVTTMNSKSGSPLGAKTACRYSPSMEVKR